MTPPSHAAEPTETAVLATRVDAVERALVLAEGRIDPGVADRIAAAVAGVRERLALGVDHTVVALVGGTGSGKSSLFNAISGLTFADVGVRRPTTSEVTACVWGSTGSALLDWLGVSPARRMERESALDADSQAALRGLVLLDLPDHDSIEGAHREIVDRLLPMVDLLVWVVDPQKYADDALHTGYLRRLVGHEDAMVVVLNQIDTVPEEVRASLTADVARLLRADGLTGVRVLTASARTGAGVGDLRRLLGEVAGRRSIAATRAGAEITDAAELVGVQVGPRERAARELPTVATVEAFAQAAGLPAVAEALEAVVRGGRGAIPEFGAVQIDTVEVAREDWLAQAGDGLPPRWQRALADRVASTDVLRQAVDERLAEVGIAGRRSRAAASLTLGAVLAAVGAAVVAAALVWSWFDLDSGEALPWVLGLAGLALILGVLAVLVRRHDARRRSALVRRDGRAALSQIVEHQLAEPTVGVLGVHREIRELARSAVRR